VNAARLAPNLEQADRELLRAALFCFNRYGWTENTISRIRAAIPNRKLDRALDPMALAISLHVEALRSYHAALQAELSRSEAPRASIGRIVDAQLSWVVSHPDEAHFLLSTSHAIPFFAHVDEAVALHSRQSTAVGQWHRSHGEPWQVRSTAIPIARVLLLAPGEELARQWIRGASKDGLLNVREPLADSIAHALFEIA